MYFDPDIVRDIVKEMVDYCDSNHNSMVDFTIDRSKYGLTEVQWDVYSQMVVDYGFYHKENLDVFGLVSETVPGLPLKAREFLDYAENERVWETVKSATKGGSFSTFLQVLEEKILDNARIKAGLK